MRPSLAIGILLVSIPASAHRLTILHTNDIHSHIGTHGPGGRYGGDARIAAKVAEIRAANPSVLFLDGGDWVEGSFYFRFNQPASVDPMQWSGTADLSVMEVMGYDGIVLGNHDYIDYNRTADNGTPPPLSIIERFQRSTNTYPVLSLNFISSALPALDPYLVDQADAQPFATFDVGGTTIAIAGLTEELFIYQMYLADSVLDDPTPSPNPGAFVQPFIDQMNASSPAPMVTMLLNHIGHGEDEDIARNTTGLDIIVGGHSHSRLFTVDTELNAASQPVHIVQAGSKSLFLGQLDLDVDHTTGVVTLLDYKLHPIDQNVPTDPTVGAVVQTLRNAVVAKHGNVFDDNVATMTVDIGGGSRESSVSNLIVDAVFAKTQGAPWNADVAWVSNGAVSNPGEPFLDGLRPGRVRSEDVYRVYGHGYNPQADANFRIFLVDYTGADLLWFQETFNFGDTVASLGEGLWIHMAGGEVTYDPTLADMSRVTSFSIGGQPVQPATTYTVAFGEGELATIDYLAGAGFPIPSYSNKRSTGIQVWQAIRDYLAAASPVGESAVDVEGRYRSEQADLGLNNYAIGIAPPTFEIGDTATLSVRIENFGETASTGGTLEVYADRTPFVWADDPSYDVGSRIAAVPIPSIAAFPGSATLNIPWNTTGQRPGRVPLYFRLVGLSEPNDTNHFAFRYADGLRVPWRLVGGPGPGPANAPTVRVFEGLGTPDRRAQFAAYGATGYGVNVDAEDVDGAATDDEILTGPGPGAAYGPQFRAFRLDGTPIAKVNGFAYGTLKFGVNVAGAGIDADAFGEILTGAGPGPVFGPHVRAFNYDGAAVTAISKVNFFAYATLKYGVNVAGGEIDGDGRSEILTGPGPSPVFTPQVRGFNYDGVSLSAIGKVNFNAYAAGFYGVRVGAGSHDGDVAEEIVTGNGPDPLVAGRVRGYNFDNTVVTSIAAIDFLPFTTRYGVRVATGDLDADGFAEILATPGPAPTAEARARGYNADAGTALPAGEVDLLLFDVERYGANVAVASLAP